jgi:hypothetical protein
MITELYSEKIANITKFQLEVTKFLNFIVKIYKLSLETKKIESANNYLETLLKVDINNTLDIIENSELARVLLDIINTTLNTIIKKGSNILIDTNVNFRIFTTNYHKLLRNCDIIDKKLYILVTDELYTEYFEKFTEIKENEENENENENEETEIKESFTVFSNLFKTRTYAFVIYKNIVIKLLDDFKHNIAVYSGILSINERMKTFVISIPNENLLKNKIPLENSKTILLTNPYLKTFSLLPISNIDTLEATTRLLFPHSTETLEKLCQDKKYDLIITKKYLNRGINYYILDLLHFSKSKNYFTINSNDDGITVDTIERFNNINYITSADKGKDFKINYNYKIKLETNKYVIILEEIYPNHYHIMSNVYSIYGSYFVRKVLVQEFIDFIDFKHIKVDNPEPRSRIENYNTVINSGIMKNMFSSKKFDIKKLSEKSYAANPNQLRFDIFTNIMKKYKQLSTNPIKTIFAFSKLLHREEFIQIFEHTITTEYNNILKQNTELYEKYHVDKSELYLNFIYDLNTYERDFKKKLHDKFINNIVDIIKSDIFTKSPENINTEFYNIFNKLVLDVLNTVITIEKNVFQSLNYKLYLMAYNT